MPWDVCFRPVLSVDLLVVSTSNMRSLVVRTHWKSKVDLDLKVPVACHVGEDGGALLLRGRQVARLAQAEGGDGTAEWVALGEVPEGLGRCLRVVDFGDGSAAAAFASGSVARMEAASPEAFLFEEVGCVADGLEAMSCSPDGETLVLVTGAGRVVLMNREFDPLREVPLHTDRFGSGQLVDVGWGKKETQFHGSLGKAAAREGADALRAAAGGQGLTSPGDDGGVRISWRDDGDLFTVSCVSPPGGDDPPRRRRVLRVFSREGELQATSEATAGLEHNLAWKPSGTLMAATVRHPNKYEVAFFEKNGLGHGGFRLQLAEDSVVSDLQWSKNSDALLVVAATPSGTTVVQVYTCSNYHWSLSNSWQFTEALVHQQWDLLHDTR